MNKRKILRPRILMIVFVLVAVSTSAYLLLIQPDSKFPNQQSREIHNLIESAGLDATPFTEWKYSQACGPGGGTTDQYELIASHRHYSSDEIRRIVAQAQSDSSLEIIETSEYGWYVQDEDWDISLTVEIPNSFASEIIGPTSVMAKADTTRTPIRGVEIISPFCI